MKWIERERENMVVWIKRCMWECVWVEWWWMIKRIQQVSYISILVGNVCLYYYNIIVLFKYCLHCMPCPYPRFMCSNYCLCCPSIVPFSIKLANTTLFIFFTMSFVLLVFIFHSKNYFYTTNQDYLKVIISL